MRTTNPLNSRKHWRHTWRERKKVRGSTVGQLRLLHPRRPRPPLVIKLTRVSVGTMDSDNLQATLKGVRDGVQDWLGIDDGSDLLSWEYEQEKGPRGYHAVRIEVRRMQ